MYSAIILENGSIYAKYSCITMDIIIKTFKNFYITYYIPNSLLTVNSIDSLLFIEFEKDMNNMKYTILLVGLSESQNREVLYQIKNDNKIQYV